MTAFDQVLGGDLGTVGEVDVDPRVLGVGLGPGRPKETKRARRDCSQVGLLPAEVGVGHDERVDGVERSRSS